MVRVKVTKLEVVFGGAIHRYGWPSISVVTVDFVSFTSASVALANSNRPLWRLSDYYVIHNGQ